MTAAIPGMARRRGGYHAVQNRRRQGRKTVQRASKAARATRTSAVNGSISASMSGSISGSVFRRLRRIAALGAALAIAGNQCAWATSITVDNLTGTARQEWWLTGSMNYGATWPTSVGDNVTVAVVGDELDLKSEDLKGAFVNPQGFSPKVPALDTKPSSPVCYDTEVASLIAGRGHVTPSGRDGTVGIAPHALIMPIVIVPGLDGLATVTDTVQSIQSAVSAGAKVIQLDYKTHADPRVTAAVQDATAHGAIVVAPVGDNGNAQTSATPANVPGVIAVAGIQRSDLKHWASSVSAPYVQVAAPATDMTVEEPRKQYGVKSGNACAAALVSGELADVWSLHPGWTVTKVKNALIQTASGHGTRVDDQIGYGIANPAEGVRYTPPAPPHPSASASSSSKPGSTASGGGGSSSGVGQIALIAGAVVVGLGLIAGLVVFLKRRRPRRYILPEPAPLLNRGPLDYPDEYPSGEYQQAEYPSGEYSSGAYESESHQYRDAFTPPETQTQQESSGYAYPNAPVFQQGPVAFDERGYTVYPQSQEPPQESPPQAEAEEQRGPAPDEGDSGMPPQQ